MLVSFFLPNLRGGGAERVAVACANDLVARGHDVDIVLVDGGGELQRLLTSNVNVVELKASRTIAALPRLVRYLRQRRPGALHAFMWPNTIVAIIAHRLARSKARLVISDHTHYSQHFNHIDDKPQLRQFRWTSRLFYPWADVRIACSEAAAEDLCELSRIPRDRFEVIHSPISPPSAPLRSSADVEAMWGGATRRIISVGSMNPVKNHALLIRAFALMKDEEAVLMILGDGRERARLEALAAELGVAGRVVMPGFVMDPWPYLASARLFVLSSDYEGSPVALAEAMYAGLSVVSTNCVSGPAELLDGGRFGALVPCGDAEALADAMCEALTKPENPDALRRRALDIAGPGAIIRYNDLLFAG